MKVLLAGDLHGDIVHTRYLFQVAQQNQASLIIALGDFGFFPGRKWSDEFLNSINKMSAKEGIPIWWLDGNHENHDLIESMVDGDPNRLVTTKSLTQQWDNLFYLPRGYRFELDGISFMSYGGAFSVDRSARVKYISWFPNEIIDHDHVLSLPNEHVDILLSHDAPFGYELGYNKYDLNYAASSNNSSSLLSLCKKITPRYTFSGHHHVNYKYQIQHDKGVCDSYIINCNMTRENSWALLNTEQMKEFL
jgi:Icc-related predicted phosphoesterase